jgi:magnesium transporter
MISAFVYRDNKFASANPAPASFAALRAEPGVLLWIDLSEPTDEEIKLVLEDTFQFHPLAIEDCVTDSPIPKIEDFEDYLLVVMHAVSIGEEQLETAEVDLFIGKNYLVTFHRQPLRPLQITYERYARQGIVVRGPDRLAHALLDQLAESYKPALAALQHELDEVETGALQNLAADELFPRVVDLRKKLSSLRQIVRPQREIATELAHGKTKLIRPLIVPYLRDLAKSSPAWRRRPTPGATNSSSPSAFTSTSPPTGQRRYPIPHATPHSPSPCHFGRGVVGMNYEHMPELGSFFGYPLAALFTLSGTLVIFWAMRKRKWL